MLVNPAAPPFDNPELRRAMGLAFDRQAFSTSSTRVKGRSAATCAAAGRNMGIAPEVLQTCRLRADVEKNRLKRADHGEARLWAG